MASEDLGTLERIAQGLADGLSQFRGLADPAVFQSHLRDLAIEDPVDLTVDTAFAQKLAAVVTVAQGLAALIDQLSTAVEAEDLSAAVSAAGSIFDTGRAIADALDGVAGDLTRASAGTSNADALAALAANFTERLLGSVLAEWLEIAHPLIESVFRLLGIIERAPVVRAIDGLNRSVVRRRIFFERVPRLFSDPVGVFADAYGWGTPGFDAKGLIRNAAEVFSAIGPLAGGITDADPVLTQPDDEDTDDLGDQDDVPPEIDFLTIAFGKSGDSPPGLEAILNADVGDDQQIDLGTIGDNWRFTLNLGGSYREGLSAKLLPPLALVFTPTGGVFQGHLGLSFVGQRPNSSDRLTVFSITSGCKIDANSVTAELLADLAFNAVTQKATADLGFRFHIQGGRVLISQDPDGGDGFLDEVLPAKGIEIDFDFGIKWTPSQGLQFEGSAGVELNVAVNKTLGPVTIAALDLAAKVDSTSLFFSAGVVGSLAIGPVVATLQNVGVGFLVDLASRGSLGGADLTVEFKRPDGIGIAVNAGPVSGGGFLAVKDSQYSGALALQVYSVAVKAFGVIDTKLANNQPGFSFFIIISAEFQPIQLGFGFTLLGVGGLIGINRDLNEDGLAAAVKAGTLDNVLFPKDPIRDAPTILADVETLFPAAKGFYAFGPLARIGWGTPAIIDARIGVVLVFPGPKIALLGTITAQLPPGATDPDLRLVEIHMDIDGILDFPKKHFEMDAHLHDSQVRGFPISGDMAARMDWGDNPNFAVSLGGFHPHYTPPSKFPTLRRLSIDLGIKGNPSATLQGYMALTSNTAQVGAALDVRAHANGASLSGGLAFDALFVFSPFSFDATLEGGVHVDFHGAGFGMHFHGEISGPAPWHLRGDVCVSVLWWDACVGFDLTLGGESKPELPAIDIWAGSTPNADGHQDVPGLQSAVTSAGNWTGVLPAGGYQIVSITQNDSTHSRVDPLGVATFQQKVAPLQLAISKFAGRNRAKTDVVTVTLQSLTVNGEDLVAKQRTKPVSDFFAPVQYQNVPDSQALSSPSFQQLLAGFNFSSDDIVFGTEQTQPVGIHTIVIGGSAATGPDYFPPETTLVTMTGRSATASAGVRKTNIDRFVNFAATLPFALATEVYLLASKSSLTRYASDSTSDAAYALKADLLAALSADVRAGLQIIPRHELPS